MSGSQILGPASSQRVAHGNVLHTRLPDSFLLQLVTAGEKLQGAARETRLVRLIVAGDLGGGIDGDAQRVQHLGDW